MGTPERNGFTENAVGPAPPGRIALPLERRSPLHAVSGRWGWSYDPPPGRPKAGQPPLGGSDPRSGGAWGRYFNQPRFLKYTIGTTADSTISASANG